MAADGISRTSDRERFGTVAVQSQAGAENALAGIAQANADNIPILVLPGGNSLSQLAVTPNYNVTKSYVGIAKSVEAIYKPDQINTVMRRAFSSLRNGRPAPVVVELTSDVVAAETPNEISGYNVPSMMHQLPESTAIQSAAKALLES